MYSCAAAPVLISLCWPWLAAGYSQPLVEPHFTGQWHRHPVDESFGLFCHIRLGAGHLQLNDTPTDVLRGRRRAKLSIGTLTPYCRPMAEPPSPQLGDTLFPTVRCMAGREQPHRQPEPSLCPEHPARDDHCSSSLLEHGHVLTFHSPTSCHQCPHPRTLMTFWTVMM